MIRGSVPFDDRIDSQRLAEHLGASLRRASANVVTVTEDRVFFTSGIFVSSFNVTVPFSSGEMILKRKTGRIEYDLSIRGLLLILVVFSVIALAGMIELQFPRPMIPLMLVLIWVVIGGMNVLIGRTRFESFLRKTVDEAKAATLNLGQ